MNLRDWQKTVNLLAHDRGWYDGNVRTFPEALCLIHSEVSEALEEYRNGHIPTKTYYTGAELKPEGIPTELADIVIRVLDLAEECGIDMELAVSEKHNFNTTRPTRHGGKVI